MDTMHSLIDAVLLGSLEGITEFLPISSTGHLIVAAHLLQFRDPEGVFEVVVQSGAVLAVLWFYRLELWEQCRAVRSDTRVRRFWTNILIAFLPAAVLGFSLEHVITRWLFTMPVVAGALMVGGAVFWLVEHRPGVQPQPSTLYSISPRQALLVGLAQVAALIPGVSRSGASIVGGLLCGLDRETATAFSFYLAIPTLGGATLYKLLKHARALLASGGAVPLALGTLCAFAISLLAIRWLLRYVAHHDFRGFAVYRILAGLVILSLYLAGRIG